MCVDTPPHYPLVRHEYAAHSQNVFTFCRSYSVHHDLNAYAIKQGIEIQSIAEYVAGHPITTGQLLRSHNENQI